MQNTLKLREIDMNEIGTDLDEATRGYFAVKVRNLFPETVPPFEIHLLSSSRLSPRLSMTKVWNRHAPLTGSFQNFLLKEDVTEVYLKKADEGAFFDYFGCLVRRVMTSLDEPFEKKAMLLYDHAEIVVRKILVEKPTAENVRIGYQFVEDFATLVNEGDASVHSLFSLFAKDYSTFTHSVQVAILGMCYCRCLGWGKDRLLEYGLGALFHDVGKTRIDGAILNKPSKLDRDELELVKEHAALGYVQLRDTHSLSKIQLSVVLHHHEAVDGSGYPHGLKGENIHECARVAKIIDCFDALTTKRVYKDALPPGKALEVMIREMRGSFDPEFFRAFVMFLG